MWIKEKHVFKEHAQLPTVEDRNDTWRIYYSFRENSFSFINYFELSKQTLDIIYRNEKPVLSPGKRGCFDDSGVMPSFVKDGFLYYTGWHLRRNVPYGHAIGKAKFNEKRNEFDRIYNGPILDRSNYIPFLANSPFVKENLMWFCNGTGWEEDFPTYNISLARRIYDEAWVFDKVLIGKDGEACSRPFIYKGSIFYAKKTKNTKYVIYENDTKILTPEKFGWDSEMTCYPYIVDDLMFYNGNGYGESGIGVAKYGL